MQPVRAGLELAEQSAREVLQGWRSYWAIISPWSYVLIALTLVYRWRYPMGSDNLLLDIIWQLVLLGVAILLAWNWANALAGRPERLDFSRGWESSLWLEYMGGMALVIVAVPVVTLLAVSMPVLLIATLLGGGEMNESVFSAYLLGAIGWLLYYHARVLPMSPALIARQSMPLPTIWKASGQHQLTLFTALFAVVVGVALLALMLGQFAVMLERLGVPYAGVLLWPFSLALSIFFYGTYFLLAHKAYALLQKG